MPKNLAQPKKRGKIKATPFLDAFEVSGSEFEVRILIKILVLKLSNLMTLIVRNCTQNQPSFGLSRKQYAPLSSSHLLLLLPAVANLQHNGSLILFATTPKLLSSSSFASQRAYG